MVEVREPKMWSGARDYVRRMRKDPGVPYHELEEEGVWRIRGGKEGTPPTRRKHIPGAYAGRFFDALIEALRNTDFYADWQGDSHRAGSEYSGIVEKVEVTCLIPDADLDAFRTSLG